MKIEFREREREKQRDRETEIFVNNFSFVDIEILM